MHTQENLAIFTICSNNYMAFAKILLESARKHHPNSRIFLCLADEYIGQEGFYPEGCEVILARDLGIPDFDAFAFRYDVMEFNTAVKPFVFSRLFDDGFNQVLYFDPDIEVFNSLDCILEPLRAGANFVLTPHLTRPNEGDAPPNDITIMRAGVYNLGFLGASRSEETEGIVRWWARRLRYQCINDQNAGIFVDQKFMDLVPGFVSNVAIIRDTTVNVAYWNLTQRQLDHDGNGWTVDGQPLGFFHFSGFNPKTPRVLSKHTPLFRDDSSAPLAAIMEHYARQLIENGYGTVPSGEYAYGKFLSGVPVPDVVRRMFRETHLTWSGNPFQNYEEYIHLPSAEAAGNSSRFAVTNFMKYLRDHNSWLTSRFDLNNPLDVKDFVQWYLDHGTTVGVDPRMLEPVAERVGRHRAPPSYSVIGSGEPDSRPDVSVVGYLRTASGVGEVGRLTLETLAAAGVDAKGYDVSLNVTSPRIDERCAASLRDTIDGRVQIFNINADQLPLVIDDVRPNLRGDAYRVAVPFWELSQFPDAWVGAFEHVDEIWAPTHFIQAALTRKINKPVLRMPIALDFSISTAHSRDYFGLPKDKFVFYFSFDFLSYADRKNPRGVVQAFKQAFRQRHHRADVALVLKSINGARADRELAAIREEFAADPDILLIDQSLTREEMLSLIKASDAVISLHRSEGLGLLVAEAIALGKPVISTDYSATTELITPATGYPVDYRLIPLTDGQYPFWEGQVWAEPDVGHAAWHMRRIIDNFEEAQRKTKRAKERLNRGYGRDRVGCLKKERLRQLGLV